MKDERLARLIEMTKAVASQRDVPALLAGILDSVIQVTGAERGFLVLREEGWRVAAARNMEQEEISRAQEKISKTVLERLLDEGRPLLLADADLPTAESLQQQKVRAVCAVPLGGAGAIYLDHRDRSARGPPRIGGSNRPPRTETRPTRGTTTCSGLEGP